MKLCIDLIPQLAMLSDYCKKIITELGVKNCSKNEKTTYKNIVSGRISDCPVRSLRQQADELF